MAEDRTIGLGGAFAGIIGVVVLVYIVWVVLMFILGSGFLTPVMKIGAGQVGVQDTFGNVDDKVLMSGITFKNPLTNVVMFDTRTQNLEGSGINVLTSEGLQVGVHATILIHVQQDKACQLYKDTGSDYVEKIVMPEVRAVLRDEVAMYKAEDIYSNERGAIATDTLKKLNDRLNSKGIIIESVLIRDVALPQAITDAIQRKQQAEQTIQQANFELETTKINANKAREEAQGKADAANIMSQTLDDKNLAWEYIQAIKAHPGAIIYLPNDPNSALQLIRNVN